MGCCNCTSTSYEEKNGYAPLHPDVQSQLYPYGTNALLAGVNAGGVTNYKPAVQAIPSLLPPAIAPTVQITGWWILNFIDAFLVQFMQYAKANEL